MILDGLELVDGDLGIIQNGPLVVDQRNAKIFDAGNLPDMPVMFGQRQSRIPLQRKQYPLCLSPYVLHKPFLDEGLGGPAQDGADADDNRQRQDEIRSGDLSTKVLHILLLESITNTLDRFNVVGVLTEFFPDLADMYINGSVHNIDVLSPNRIEE